MILVKPEVIESVADQLTMNGAESYIKYLMKEMQEENPHLTKSILGTALCVLEEIKKHHPDLDSGVEAFIFSNMCAVPMVVYNSIKQQMICNELENA